MVNKQQRIVNILKYTTSRYISNNNRTTKLLHNHVHNKNCISIKRHLSSSTTSSNNTNNANNDDNEREQKNAGSVSTVQYDKTKEQIQQYDAVINHASDRQGKLSTNITSNIQSENSNNKLSSNSGTGNVDNNNDSTSHSATDDLTPKQPIINTDVNNNDNIQHTTDPDDSTHYSEPQFVSSPQYAASPISSNAVSSANASIPIAATTIQDTNNDIKHVDNDKKKDLPEPASTANSPLPAAEIRGLLWFDNLYPMRAAYIDFRHYLVTHNHESTIPTVMKAACGDSVEIIEMIPRIKEGGVFVRFKTHDTQQYPSPESVAEAVIKQLKEHPHRAWLTPQPIHSHLVYGSPFLEDLLRVFPANRLRIEIKGDLKLLAEVTVEQLYVELRPFGTLSDMSLGPCPEKPNIPRIATVQFQRMYSAVGARNCLHRYKIPIGAGGSNIDGVTLYLYYESLLKTSVITDFFNRHTRIMIPFLGLLLALFTYIVFDPIREFNVINHITKRFTLSNLENSYSKSRIARWLNDKYRNIMRSRFINRYINADRDNAENIEIVWSGRKMDEDKVTKWLHSVPDRILFLTGPKGAGKLALVDKVTKDKPNVVRLDFSTLVDRNDDEFIKGFSNLLGFKPGFSFLTFVSQLLDIVTPGASKATGSQSQFGTQLNKIFEVTSSALIEIAKKYHPHEIETRHILSANNNPALSQNTQHGRISVDTNKTSAKIHINSKGDNTKNDGSKTDGLDKAVNDNVDKTNVTQDNSSTTAPQPSQSKPSPISTDVKVDNTDANGKNNTNIFSSTFNTITSVFGGSDNDNNAEQQSKHTDNTTQLNDNKSRQDSSDTHNAEEDQSLLSRLFARGKQDDSVDKKQHKDHDKQHKHSNFDDDDSGNKPKHQHKSTQQYDSQDAIPLFIIDGFNTDNKDKHNSFMLTFTAWADNMTKLGLARFIYLSDSTLEEHISKTLPDAKLTEVMLADASKENAIEFVQASMRRIREAEKQQEDNNNNYQQEQIEQNNISVQHSQQQQQPQQQSNNTEQLQQSNNTQQFNNNNNNNNYILQQHQSSTLTHQLDPNTQSITDQPQQADDERTAQELDEIKQAIDIVGGRYNDLQTLVRGLESGSTPRDVVEDMVATATNNLRSVLFSDDKSTKDIQYNKVQLWLTINKLVDANRHMLLYDDLLFNVFKGNDVALRQLVRADLLRIEQQPHSRDRIKAGSGIQLEAMKRIVIMEKLRPGFDLLVAKYMINEEQKKIDSCEDELLKLSNLMHNELDLRRYLQHDESVVLKDIDIYSNGMTAAAVAKRRVDVLKLLNDSVDKYAQWDQRRRVAENEIKKPVILVKEDKDNIKTQQK